MNNMRKTRRQLQETSAVNKSWVRTNAPLEWRKAVAIDKVFWHWQCLRSGGCHHQIHVHPLREITCFTCKHSQVHYFVNSAENK